jgi:KDO2-lipid IV(A) lauroyltransferase
VNHLLYILTILFNIKYFGDFFRKTIENIIAFIFSIFNNKYYKIIKKQFNLTNISHNFLTIFNTNKSIIRSLFFVIKTKNYNKEELKQIISIENEKDLNKLLETDNFIFTTAHYSNWELLFTYLTTITKVNAVGKLQKNENFYNFILENRIKFGGEVFKKEGALRKSLKSLNNGINIFMLLDQNTNMNDGVLCNFFNINTPFLKTQGILSQKTKKKTIFIWIEWDNETEKYIIKWNKPYISSIEDKEIFINDTVNHYVISLENIIKKKPEEWMWVHKKWKSIKPELYNKI